MGNVSGFFNIIAKVNSSFCMSGSLFFVLPCSIQCIEIHNLLLLLTIAKKALRNKALVPVFW